MSILTLLFTRIFKLCMGVSEKLQENLELKTSRTPSGNCKHYINAFTVKLQFLQKNIKIRGWGGRILPRKVISQCDLGSSKTR